MSELRNILLVEDDRNTVEVLSRLMKAAHRSFHGEVEVHSCSTWEGAMLAMSEFKADVIILDLTLPPETAEEIVEHIKRFDHSRCPIVVVTGNTSDKIRRDSFRSGASDFVSKDLCVTIPECLLERVYNAFIRHQITYGSS